MATMQAWVRDRYGPPDVLRLETRPRPEPGPGEVRVRIRTIGLNGGDWRLLRADPFIIRLALGGVLRPKHPVLGSDAAGVVDVVGPGVTRFQPGDRVFGETSAHGFGAFAEFVVAGEDAWHSIPESVGFAAAAATPVSGRTALAGLRLGGLAAGRHVLVNGASGGVGSFAVQLARAHGAQVTAVCSARHANAVRTLGPDAVLDYTREDFTVARGAYDLILDMASTHPMKALRAALRPGGSYVMVSGPVGRMLRLGLGGGRADREGRRMQMLMPDPDPADLASLAGMLGDGSLQPLVGARYPFGELPGALRDLESRKVPGKLVMELSEA